MTEINTAEFMRAFDAWAKKAEVSAEQAFKALVLDIFKSIQIRTPVDTGRLRGNWQVEFDGEQSATVYNNLPYAERIENGWSQQAPSGMVRVTLTEFEQRLREAARDNQI